MPAKGAGPTLCQRPALAEDLRRFLAGEPIQARPTSTWEVGAKWVKRQPALATLAAACTVALLALLVGGTWFTLELATERTWPIGRNSALEQEQLATAEKLEAEPARRGGEAVRRAQAILYAACAAVNENAWAAVNTKMEKKDDHIPGGILYNLACVYSLAATATRKDAALTPADRHQMAEQYAARAVELLANAHAVGYFTVATKLDRLKQDRDLEALRGRADFQQLLSRLEKKWARRGCRVE